MIVAPVLFIALVQYLTCSSKGVGAFRLTRLPSSSVVNIKSVVAGDGMKRAMNDANGMNLLAQKTTAADWSPHWLNKSNKKTFSPLVSLNYIAATALQWSLLFGFTTLFDAKILPFLAPYKFRDISAASAVVAFLLALFSLRSRIFSPLNNRRPKASNSDSVFKNRKRPSWQPPAVAFPIIWSTIAVLRVASGTMIFNELGGLSVKPILCFLAHLSIGDTWNTINNVDNRLGTAALGVLFVLASVFYTTYQYYLVLPRAAFVLAPSCLWLSVATVLVFSIWRLNMKNFRHPSFFPSKEEGPPSRWKIPLLP